jgi:uroporphyrinogen-III synthase
MTTKNKKSATKTATKTVSKSAAVKSKKGSTPKIVKKNAVKKAAPKKALLKKAAPKKSVKKTIATKKVVKKATPVKNKNIPVSKIKKLALKKETIKKPTAKKVVAKKTVSKKLTVVLEKPKKVQPAVKVVPDRKNETLKNKVEVVSTEKFVKTGIKTKKQLIPVAPQPVIEVSNFPKHRVKTILISQPKPENDKNPYYDLAKKYSLIETFRQFIKIEGVSVKDFRLQRVDILEHKAVILTSRLAVDHYFRMCNEMRVTVPESMKYFCINEATAYYLQKYIQYRKRKIFFGHQTIQDLVDVIKKNKEEKFLLPAADVHKEQICDFLDAINVKYTKAVMYKTVSANLSDIKNLNEFDIIAFFTPAGIKSLKNNFPNFKQGNTRIACFGAATVNELRKHGYRLDIYAPNPKNPSMSAAIDEYIKEANKR